MELPELSFDDLNLEQQKAGELKICTVPVYAYLFGNGVSMRESKQKINLKLLYDNFSLDDKFRFVSYSKPVPSFKCNDEIYTPFFVRKNKKNRDKKLSEGKSGSTTFGNCVTFRYIPDDFNIFSVKVYANYTVHITGCKFINQAETLIESVILPKIKSSVQQLRIHYLNGSITLKVMKCYPTDTISYTKGNMKTAMNNSQFNAHFNLDIDELNSLIKEISKNKSPDIPEGYTISVVEKAGYKGLPIILQSYTGIKINIMVFWQGKHLISSNREDANHIGYAFITNVFSKYYDRLCLKTVSVE